MDDLKVGVLGVGAMGTEHVATLATAVAGARVVAIADADPARAHAVAHRYPDIKVVDDPHSLVASSDVEAVVVASPDATHESLTMACLLEGKPVLCEKPLATSAVGCQRIVEEECAIRKRLVSLGFMRRFDPAYTAMKRALAAREVGEPRILHLAHRTRHAPAGSTTATAITNAAVHEIDLVRWLLNTEIATATVHIPAGNSRPRSSPADPILLVLTTTAGHVADIELFLNAHYGYEVRCEVVADHGTLDLQSPTSYVRRADGQAARAVATGFGQRFHDAYRLELQAWVESIHSGQWGGATAWDGYAATLTAEACVLAADEARLVRVPDSSIPRLYQH